MTNSISLYIHIPFCVKKCDYCAFYSLGNSDEKIKNEYYFALQKQIELFETEKTVSTVYFGGGTPPVLGIHRICSLLELIIGRFGLATDCEITVEVNPGTVDEADLKALYSAGFNRLSVGVQSADDGILKSIGRIHSFAQAKECISNARRAGFENISADIMFALPYQGMDGFCDGIYDIMSTNVEHISAYSLQLEEGTALYRRQNELSFPSEEVEEAQYAALCEILEKNGYEHYEISSFAKSGYESKHNMNYWQRGEYFGFGAAAHSFYRGKRFSAVSDVYKFIELSKISAFDPTDFDVAPFISEEEAEEERIMLGLRTAKGISVEKSKEALAMDLAKIGYGSFEKGVFALNDKGFRVSNSIIEKFLVD